MIKTIENAMKDLYDLEGLNIDIKRTDEARFGVYTTNVAFIISQKIKRTPEVIAREIVQSIIDEEHAFLPSAAKGNINFSLPEEVHLGHYEETEGNNSELSSYMIYRLKFLKRRLEGSCMRLDRIEFFNEYLKEFYIQFFIHGRYQISESNFLKFDRLTDYRELNNYQYNIFYTLVDHAFDRIEKNA
jgi:hypothetical protein